MPWQALRMLDAVLCVVNNGEDHEKKRKKRENYCVLHAEV
jgi:hypothetical protein